MNSSRRVQCRDDEEVKNDGGIFMSAADNNDVQGSRVSIRLIYAIGVPGALTFSQAITVARDGIEPRISVAH
jgi:hypothetical protein